MCCSSWMHYVKLLVMSLASVLGSDVRYYRDWEMDALFSCHMFGISCRTMLARLCYRVCHPNSIRVAPCQASASLLASLSPEFDFELVPRLTFSVATIESAAPNDHVFTSGEASRGCSKTFFLTLGPPSGLLACFRPFSVPPLNSAAGSSLGAARLVWSF